jgi:tetratricopeptide (TPR) repeat protein
MRTIVGLIMAHLSLAAILPSLACAQESNICDQVISSPEIREKLIADYEATPASVVDDRLLAVAIGYVVQSNLDKAKPAYLHYLHDHPNQTRALRGLGTVNALQGNFDDAVNLFSASWSLGDIESLEPLAYCYLQSKKYDQMERLVPSLLRNKRHGLDIVDCLLAYAMLKDPPDENLISQSLDGIGGKEIATNEETAALIDKAANRLKAIDETNKTLLTICGKFTDGYEADPNGWPRDKLPGVGDAYFLLRDYTNADVIYRQVLKGWPENQDALFGVGTICMMKQEFPEAIGLLRKDWSLGEKRVLPNLAAAYMAAKDYSGMKDLIPNLLEIKSENIEMLNTLLLYALAKIPVDKDLFYKTLEGVSNDQILRRPDTTDIVLKGLKLFGDEDRVNQLLKMKAVQDKGVGG